MLLGSLRHVLPPLSRPLSGHSGGKRIRLGTLLAFHGDLPRIVEGLVEFGRLVRQRYVGDVFHQPCALCLNLGFEVIAQGCHMYLCSWQSFQGLLSAFYFHLLDSASSKPIMP